MHWVLAAILLVLPALAQTKKTVPAPSAFNKETMEAYIRHQFMLPPNLKVLSFEPKPSEVPGLMLVEVTVTDGGATNQKVPFYVSKDGTKFIQGKSFDIRQSPFAEELKSLKVDGASIAGSASAPVSIFLFSDFQCQYCKEEAKVLRANLGTAYPTQVKLIFKDFPLEQIHPWARDASIAGRCIGNMNADNFWRYHDWIFDQQANITSENLKTKITEFANSTGIDSMMLGQCMDTKATDKEVAQSVQQARALNVDRTPTLFINGRRITGNVPWEQLKAIIDYELDYAKKNPIAGKKDDLCCEVKLPIPVAK